MNLVEPLIYLYVIYLTDCINLTVTPNRYFNIIVLSFSVLIFSRNVLNFAKITYFSKLYAE